MAACRLRACSLRSFQKRSRWSASSTPSFYVWENEDLSKVTLLSRCVFVVILNSDLLGFKFLFCFVFVQSKGCSGLVSSPQKTELRFCSPRLWGSLIYPLVSPTVRGSLDSLVASRGGYWDLTRVYSQYILTIVL